MNVLLEKKLRKWVEKLRYTVRETKTYTCAKLVLLISKQALFYMQNYVCYHSYLTSGYSVNKLKITDLHQNRSKNKRKRTDLKYELGIF